jgi:hypothetical protein
LRIKTIAICFALFVLGVAFRIGVTALHHYVVKPDPVVRTAPNNYYWVHRDYMGDYTYLLFSSQGQLSATVSKNSSFWYSQCGSVDAPWLDIGGLHVGAGIFDTPAHAMANAEYICAVKDDAGTTNAGITSGIGVSK